MPMTDEEMKKYEEKMKKREILTAGAKNFANRKIDPEFYDKITKKIASDNREIAGRVAVKLLYHPLTIISTILCLACVGGVLDTGASFPVALLMGYVCSYIGIAATAFLGYALTDQFRTAPPEQFMEIVWLMSLGYSQSVIHIVKDPALPENGQSSLRYILMGTTLKTETVCYSSERSVYFSLPLTVTE